jgi:hypothetical protein
MLNHVRTHAVKALPAVHHVSHRGELLTHIALIILISSERLTLVSAVHVSGLALALIAHFTAFSAAEV